MTVQWADPPPIGGPQDPRAVYMERLRLVMKQPGRWALVRSGSPSAMHQAAGALRLRQYNIPPGEWEFTVRTFRRGVHVGDMNVASIYARYMGDDDTAWRQYMQMRGIVDSAAEWNEEGDRACPRCGDKLVRQHGARRWPIYCDDCWVKVNPKWGRARLARGWKRWTGGGEEGVDDGS